MKVLFLCNKSPFPPKEGGSIAMNSIIEGLANQGHQVKVLAVNSPKYQIDPKSIPAAYQEKTRIEFVDIDLALKPLPALWNLLRGESYHVSRFKSKAFAHVLSRILCEEQFDIVQLELLYMAPYLPIIRKHSKAKIVLRAHNIEHLIWQRITTGTKNPIKKAYLKQLTNALKTFELQAIPQFDGIAAITRTDARFFEELEHSTPVTDISFGMQLKADAPLHQLSDFPSLFHIGSMNWVPNQEGIKWFLDTAWPLIHDSYPSLKFYLAGREMPDWLLHHHYPNVEVVGEVPDATAFMHSRAVMVVPLLSGSGIRIKIIEALAAGKPVITTTIGAEGLNYTHGKDLLIADTAEAFLDAVKHCLQSREQCETLGLKGRELIYREHNNKHIIPKLLDFYHQLLSTPATSEV